MLKVHSIIKGKYTITILREQSVLQRKPMDATECLMHKLAEVYCNDKKFFILMCLQYEIVLHEYILCLLSYNMCFSIVICIVFDDELYCSSHE